jgi:16S rRNA processing protein RimM
LAEYAFVGRIRKAQGIKGDVAVEMVTDDPDRFFAPGKRLFAGTVDGEIARHPADRRNPESTHELVVVHAAPQHRGGMIVHFDAIHDRTAAETWRGRFLLVPANELEPPAEDEVFLHELLGVRVTGTDGRELGTVAGWYELPQGVTLELSGPAASVLVPYRPDLVREVDLDARTMIVETESGLFD